MVFLTGANGYLGKRVLEYFVKNKVKVVALVRSENSIDVLKEKFPKVKFVLGDLNDKKVLSSVIQRGETIIHLAASVHGSAEEMNKSNIEGVKNLIEASKLKKVKKIIFLSSMAVRRPFLDDYSKSKLFGEDLCLNSGIKSVILRPTIIFGGDDLNEGSFKNAVAQINMFPFFIPVFGSGKYSLAPVHVDDVAKAVFLASGKSFDKYGVFEIGGKVVNFNEFVKILKKKYNIRKFILHIPLFLGKFAVFLLSKILKNPPLTMEAFINATTGTEVDKAGFFQAFKFETRGFGEN